MSGAVPAGYTIPTYDIQGSVYLGNAVLAPRLFLLYDSASIYGLEMVV